MCVVVFVSPSVECDSGEEDILGHSYPCSSLKPRSILQLGAGEERDSFDAGRTKSTKVTSPLTAYVMLRVQYLRVTDYLLRM